MSSFHTFTDREALYSDAETRIISALSSGVADRGEAHMALSGGSTPAPIYERLSAYDKLDWSKVTVTLVDERMTEPNDPASNEVLVRNTLLKDAASSATFTPITEGQASVPQQDIMLLGMGGDGHFASLFPTAEELQDGLYASAPAVLRMTPNPLPANAPFPRLTLTLPTILASRALVLAITGDEKRGVLDSAQEAGPTEDLPISALLRADHPNLTILWAP
ncbi:MAG: 6-phosphogluconolactonase [Pseudomonadota bacterium]